jgi:eukaryotic-like serine/threonine-protein kinase
MAAPQLIGQAPASSSANLPLAPGRRLPDDLLRDASRRLGVIAFLAGVLWLLGQLLDHIFIHSGTSSRLAFTSADAIALVGAIVSFALFFYTRASSRSPAFILNLGLGFLIFTSAAVGLIWHWSPSTDTPAPAVSWIGVAVLLFAAVVPSTPLKTLLTGVIAVSMNPLAMAIAKASGGWQYESYGDLLRMHYWDYLVVGVAVVISQVVTQLGQQVTRAREMGSYQLGELLGQGGMGEVYRATHRMLARPAAIKLIRPEMIGEANGPGAALAVKRFRLEAQKAANLRSPHTVEVYDFGVTTDETLYFVMELLDGMTLDALVRDHGPQPANRVVHILRQVCASLQEAHTAGLMHRDIKPANIHIGRLGLSHDFVKVLDFGLVKSVESASRETSLATGIGITPGTPDYMAPEMILGERIDHRVDIYAVGCVAYYLLTGKSCFESASVMHVIARHLNEAPLPPSQRARNPVPPALEQLVLACLAKRPEQRPQSAAELSRALGAIDLVPWDEEQAAEWWREHGSPASA